MMMSMATLFKQVEDAIFKRTDFSGVVREL